MRQELAGTEFIPIAQWVKWSVASVCRRCPFVCLAGRPSVGTKTASSPDPGHSISAKYLQSVQNCLVCASLLLDTLYKHLKLRPYVLSWHPWACLPTISRYLATCTWGDGFNVNRVHYTACICETATVCSYIYPHGSACMTMWHAGYVLYRALVWLGLGVSIIA